jgi:hypothetical protein
MSAVETFRAFTKEIKKFPFPGTFLPVRDRLESLAANGFLDPEQPWFSAFQLANFIKFLIVYGSTETRRTEFDLSRPFNRYKKFWAAAEKENEYSGQPEFIAAFILRFIYQQVPYIVHRSRISVMFDRTKDLYYSNPPTVKAQMPWSLSAFENKANVPLDVFLRAAQNICKMFFKCRKADKESLTKTLDEGDRRWIDSVLALLSATRREFQDSHDKWKAQSFREIPYEFNPLLRFPIVLHEAQYWAPFPELIAYAATTGLYFYMADTFGEPFQKTFGEIFSNYAAGLFVQNLGRSSVLTELDERNSGWQGKTNDFTVVDGSKAFLFECKTSGLFFGSKKKSSVEEIAKDIRKNLANPKHRSGVFQLYDKIKAIQNGQLPQTLNASYSSVREFYAILLLHDRIEYANKQETLRNLLDAELQLAGIKEFQYQVWHIEEVQNMFELNSSATVCSTMEEKFLDPVFRPWDLNTLLFEKTGRRHAHLRLRFFVPRGETQALRIIRSLADAS